MIDLDKKPIPDESRSNFDALTPQRVRLDKRAHSAVESASKGARRMDPVTQDQHLSMWMAKGKGEMESQQGGQRGGHRVGQAKEEQKGKGSSDSSSSRSTRWRDWNYNK